MRATNASSRICASSNMRVNSCKNCPTSVDDDIRNWKGRERVISVGATSKA